jgi:hypothetical protein
MGRLGNLARYCDLIANETLTRRRRFLSIEHGKAVRTPKFFCNELRDRWNEIPAWESSPQAGYSPCP